MFSKISGLRVFLVLLIIMFVLAERAFAAPALLVNTKVLSPGRAIASWPAGIPAGEKRPVVVFLPGWGGAGAVDAFISAQNTNLVNQGYVTLAIGFDDLGGWNSNIDVKTAAGLNLLCADAAIPVNCNAIVLDGESYGGSQNYWVIEYLRSNGYAGSTGLALGFVSEDVGYGAPGYITNNVTGVFTRTGLANTASYGVAMIQNLGDTTFPVDECTWGNCGAKVLSSAHLARGDQNVFSICPPGGEHGTRGFADWNAWVVSAIKTIIHVTYGIPTFTGYTPPTLSVSNTCAPRTFRSVGGYDGWVLESGENSNVGGTKSLLTGTALIIGDNVARKQYRGILHFNTASLPDNAIIIKATLRIMKAGGAGNTSTLGGLLVDMTKPSFGTVALAITDFQTVAGKPAIFNPFTTAGSWYNATLKSTGFAYVNRIGTTQFRLRFTNDDDNDALADYLVFYSGNAALASRPQLVVQYYVP